MKPIRRLVLFSLLLFFAFPVGNLLAEKKSIAFGVDLNFYQESLRGKYAQTLDAVNRLGAGWIRTGFGFNQSDVEPSPGVWNFRAAEKVVEAAKAHNLELLIELGSPSPPRNPSGFARYAGEVARHFKGEIGAYKIFNEPQIHDGWTPHRYAEVFALASRAIHAADPAALVMAGGFWSTPKVNRFQAALFSDPDYPIGKYLNIFNIHMTETSPEATAKWLRLAHAFLEKQRLHIPIWVDEFAYPSRSETQWVPSLRNGEESQEEYFKKVLSIMAGDPDVKGIFCTYLVDEPLAARPAERWLGIMDRNFLPKPAFYIYQEFIRESRKN